MQVLKQEVHSSIINVAKELFYRNGFADTTTRQIADGVGMSVSNLYKYFMNKADIFREIVGDYHAAFRRGFIEFISHSHDSFDEGSVSRLARAIFESIKAERIKFVLLMDKSAGTEYAGFKNEVATLLERHISEGIQTVNKSFMLTLLLRHFFDSVVEIAKNYQDEEWTLNNITILVQYHMSGMKSLYL